MWQIKEGVEGRGGGRGRLVTMGAQFATLNNGLSGDGGGRGKKKVLYHSELLSGASHKIKHGV